MIAHAASNLGVFAVKLVQGFVSFLGSIAPFVRGEPFFTLGERELFAVGVVLHLIFADGADLEVFGIGVAEVESADGGAGVHGKAGEGGAAVFRRRGFARRGLLCVIGLEGISGGGANAAVAFLN